MFPQRQLDIDLDMNGVTAKQRKLEVGIKVTTVSDDTGAPENREIVAVLPLSAVADITVSG